VETPPPISPPVAPIDRPTDPRGSAEPVPLIEGVRLDPRRPLTQPAYPAPDIRAGNEGNADIEVYVLPNGRVGDARIVRSTGHPRLDQAAIEEAKKSWRLIPATRDGVAFAQWHRLRVVFRLTKE
jgi:protein TonB